MKEKWIGEKFLDFPVSEYENRLTRCRRLMEEKNVDVLIVTQPENVVYLTGFSNTLFDSKYWTKGMGAIITMDQEPIVFCPTIAKSAATRVVWVEDVRLWSPYLDFGAKFAEPEKLIVSTIKDLKSDKRTIGLELGTAVRTSMPYTEIQQLKTMLPQANLVDASEVFVNLRMIKSMLEIERIRKACKITDKAIDGGFRALKDEWRRGITQIELAQIINQTMIKEGASRSHHILIWTGPPYLDIADSPNLPIRVKRGNIVNVDVGAIYGGYTSDFMRIAFVGKESDMKTEWKKMFEATKNSVLAGIELIRPGAKSGDAYNASRQAIKKAGFEEHFSFGGHSIGLEVHELPRMSEAMRSPDASFIWQPGMVTSIEPAVFPARATEGAPDSPGFWLEENVAVTEKGHEVLSSYDLDLYYLLE